MSTALSENIRRLRKAADQSVSEAARKAGIHRVAWTEIEQGKNANPTTSTLSKIAGALGVTVAELFVDEDGESVTLLPLRWVEPHYAADPSPAKDLATRSVAAIKWPVGRVFVVLGGRTPTLLGAQTLATHVHRKFDAGQFVEYSGDEVQWLSRHPWDHLVWIGDAVTRYAQIAPSYYAVALAHTFEYAHIADGNLATAALMILVQKAAADVKAGVPFAKFPHEIQCDVAGLRHAVDIYGVETLKGDLNLLRSEDPSSAEHLLGLLGGNLEPAGDLHRELMTFVNQHELGPAIRSLWKSEEWQPYTRHLDRSDFS